MDHCVDCLRAAFDHLFQLLPSDLFLPEDQTDHVEVHLAFRARLADYQLQEELYSWWRAFSGGEGAKLSIGKEGKEGVFEEGI